MEMKEKNLYLNDYLELKLLLACGKLRLNGRLNKLSKS